MGNFQILIVLAVKICKQCLHANWFAFSLQGTPHTGSSSVDHTGRFPYPDQLGYSPPMNNFISRAPTDGGSRGEADVGLFQSASLSAAR